LASFSFYTNAVLAKEEVEHKAHELQLEVKRKDEETR